MRSVQGNAQTLKDFRYIQQRFHQYLLRFCVPPPLLKLNKSVSPCIRRASFEIDTRHAQDGLKEGKEPV